jgi:energy-coupling factor transporter ATP-binding protein EcfA2
MTIARLELTDFTAFKRANFAFCPGINVLIGENGTGKTHVLKAMYAAQRAAQEGDEREDAVHKMAIKFVTVFRPENLDIERLISRGSAQECRFRLADNTTRLATLTLQRGRRHFSVGNRLQSKTSLFVPPREVLAMYRGFMAAYEGRELDFDATYYDLCKALSAAPLRGARADAVESMLAPLESILGGKVVLQGDRFFIKQADGETEAHLVAEGLRKIASLAYLVANGALTRDSVLFWDEPEASLNPGLVVKVVDFMRTLAASGVQIFLASHDFLLVHRLSQAAEYHVEPAVPVRFFSLYRPEPGAAVEVEQADTLVDIEHNAILDEFARYYDREQDLAAQAMRAPEVTEAPEVKPASKTRAKKATSKAKPSAKKATKAPVRTVAKPTGKKASKKIAKIGKTAAKKAARA